MGFLKKLFEKKDCEICGGEIGLLGNRKLVDGDMCKACAAKLSPWFEDRRESTVAQIKEQLDFAKQSYRESSLTIQSLEVETASLRDKLAASDHNSTATGKTLVTTYPRDNQAAANTEILRSLKEDEFDDSDMNGQTDPPQMMPSSPTRRYCRTSSTHHDSRAFRSPPCT